MKNIFGEDDGEHIFMSSEYLSYNVSISMFSTDK